ncbi:MULTISPECIES: hypothetical protein [Streptomyces]|uniref:hypothetical protein n=1 Tax=Streptomyces TaxID=1883 RepID=UPI001FD24DF8|nr:MULTISPECIES: hypothetical protein [Streptomyces]MCZ4100459.1 hypothetical protein [Streptomyces sp. H39-C1]
MHRRPRVPLLVTGDEVVRHGIPPAGRVRDALGPLLPGHVDWLGGIAEQPTYLPDGRIPRPPEHGVLTAPVRRRPHETRLLPVTVVSGRATPVGHDRPGLLWGAAAADALAVLPPTDDAGAGRVELLPLPR